MPNTKKGGKKFRQTMIDKHGSLEAWKAYLKQQGAKGGKKSKGGGFTNNKTKASEAGRKGAQKRWQNKG